MTDESHLSALPSETSNLMTRRLAVRAQVSQLLPGLRGPGDQGRGWSAVAEPGTTRWRVGIHQAHLIPAARRGGCLRLRYVPVPRNARANVGAADRVRRNTPSPASSLAIRANAGATINSSARRARARYLHAARTHAIGPRETRRRAGLARRAQGTLAEGSRAQGRRVLSNCLRRPGGRLGQYAPGQRGAARRHRTGRQPPDRRQRHLWQRHRAGSHSRPDRSAPTGAQRPGSLRKPRPRRSPPWSSRPPPAATITTRRRQTPRWTWDRRKPTRQVRKTSPPRSARSTRRRTTTFRLFAPGAKSVSVVLYDTATGTQGRVEHQLKGQDDFWELSVGGDLRGKFYVYRLDGPGLDPTARGARSLRGQRGGEQHARTHHGVDAAHASQPACGTSATDIVVYEMHVRDFTMAPSSGVQHRGLYLGFTEPDTHLGDDRKSAPRSTI